MNSPATPDNTFAASPTRKDPKSYTLYKANTPFSQVNIAVDPPSLTLDAASQKLTPVTNVVLENQTGGENQTDDKKQPIRVDNIFAINAQAQSAVAAFEPPAQSVFANYALIGTVWMLPNSYNLKSNQTSAVGSVDLANGTAETFVQNANNTPISGVLNCFLCHNPTSYSFQTPPPAKLANRLVASCVGHRLALRSAELDFGQALVAAAGPCQITGRRGRAEISGTRRVPPWRRMQRQAGAEPNGCCHDAMPITQQPPLRTVGLRRHASL